MKKRTALIVLRTRQQLTQDEMAERIGVTRATYSMIECGARDGRLDFWQRLQKAFNLTDAETWELIKNENQTAETRKKIYN